jgi:Tfp pilus assembly protein PilF
MKLTDALRQAKFVDIFNLLNSKLSDLQDWSLAEELSDIRNTYTMMLRFMVKGVNDPESPRLLNELLRRSYAVSDRADRLLRLKSQRSDKYMRACREEHLQMENILMSLETYWRGIENLKGERETKREYAEVELINMHEKAVLDMFDSVWTSDVWKRNDYDIADKILQSDVVGSFDKSVLVSAVTLALLEMFDERKVMILFDAYLNADVEVNQRAIVGLLLVLRKYDERIQHYPEIVSRLSLYAEGDAFVKNVFVVMMQLQFSKMTDKVSDKMRTDIIPTIMKSKNFKKNGLGITEVDADFLKNDENPEWFNANNDDKASAKIREMADLQLEGADVYMGTFSYMKSYPFFNKTAHWFYPFTFDVPEMLDAKKLMEGKSSLVVKAMLGASPFCNSDKFSFCLMMKTIGSAAEQMLAQQVENEAGENMESMLDDAMKRKLKQADVSRFYIYDLYRFFKAYPFKSEFADVFSAKEQSFTPLATDSFNFMLAHREELLSLGEFFMRKSFYVEAMQIFLALVPNEVEEDAHLWQKIGFCQQKSGDNIGAFRSYLTADNLQPNSKWTMKHLASVAFETKNYGTAERYYDQLLEADGDNVKLLQMKVKCLMETKCYGDAIPFLYKIDYLSDKSVASQYMLALALMLNGDTDKAADMLESCLIDNPDAADVVMLLAHARLIQGKVADAYVFYRQSYNDADSFDEAFWSNVALFEEVLNIDRRNFNLIYDAVCCGALDD